MDIGLAVHPHFRRKILEKGSSGAIGRIALIGIDLESRTLIDLNVMKGLIGTGKTGMKGMCGICADEETAGQSAPIILTLSPRKAAQDVAEEGALSALVAFATDFLVIKKSNDLGCIPWRAGEERG